MVRLIIKKQEMENWTSLIKIYSFKHKLIKYRLTKWYYTKKGYEVEEINEEE